MSNVVPGGGQRQPRPDLLALIAEHPHLEVRLDTDLFTAVRELADRVLDLDAIWRNHGDVWWLVERGADREGLEALTGESFPRLAAAIAGLEQQVSR